MREVYKKEVRGGGLSCVGFSFILAAVGLGLLAVFTVHIVYATEEIISTTSEFVVNNATASLDTTAQNAPVFFANSTESIAVNNSTESVNINDSTESIVINSSTDSVAINQSTNSVFINELQEQYGNSASESLELTNEQNGNTSVAIEEITASSAGQNNLATDKKDYALSEEIKITGLPKGSMIEIYWLDNFNTAENADPESRPSNVFGVDAGDDGSVTVGAADLSPGRFALVNTFEPEHCGGLYLSQCRARSDYLGEEAVIIYADSGDAE